MPPTIAEQLGAPRSSSASSRQLQKGGLTAIWFRDSGRRSGMETTQRNLSQYAGRTRYLEGLRVFGILPGTLPVLGGIVVEDDPDMVIAPDTVWVEMNECVVVRSLTDLRFANEDDLL